MKTDFASCKLRRPFVAWLKQQSARRGVPIYELLEELAARGQSRPWDAKSSAENRCRMKTVTPHGEKVRAGQERARARGVFLGPELTMTPEMLERARAMRGDGATLRDVAKTLNLPLSTLHRALRHPPAKLAIQSDLYRDRVAASPEPLWKRVIESRRHDSPEPPPARPRDARVGDAPARHRGAEVDAALGASAPLVSPAVDADLRPLASRATPYSQHGLKVRAGQERARANGIHLGAPRNSKLTPEVLDRVRAKLADGSHLRAIAKELQVPLTTLHRAVPGLAEGGTDEERAEWQRKSWVKNWGNTTPEERRKRTAHLRVVTHEQRSEAAKKSWAAMTPEQMDRRREKVRETWARKRKAAAM